MQVSWSPTQIWLIFLNRFESEDINMAHSPSSYRLSSFLLSYHIRIEGISLYNLIFLVRRKVKDLIEVKKRHNFNFPINKISKGHLYHKIILSLNQLTNILYDACDYYQQVVSMDKLRVYLMKASKICKRNAAELSAQLDNQINSHLVSLSREKHTRQMMIIR
jgi:hypothetical protein